MATKIKWTGLRRIEWKRLAAMPRLLFSSELKSSLRFSLRLRLTLMFLAVALLVWLAAGLLTWRESREQLDEFFDSYQLLLAHQLASADWGKSSPSHPAEGPNPLKRLEAKAEAAGLDEEDLIGRADDEALSFAVFHRDGRLIFSDGD